MATTQAERLHSLDALRGGALLLGVIFHAAFSFFPGDTFWLIKDSQESASISALAFTLHIFRMTIFFLLAGYFGRMLTTRFGSIAFMRDRLVRIGAPLLIFWPLMLGCFIALAIWGLIVSNGGTIPNNTPPPPPMTLETFPLFHLWFLYLLLLFYVLTLIGRGMLGLIDRQDRVAQFGENTLLKVGWLPILPVILALPIAYSLLAIPVWHPFFGVPTPEYGFVPNQAAVITFGGAFGLGWLLQRQNQLIYTVTQFWMLYLVVALCATWFCLSTVGTTLKYVPDLSGQDKTLYAIAYALAIWCWVLGLIGMCLRCWANENRGRRYISDASYWIYLMHLPVVMALQILLSQWSIPAELKFLLIVTISIALLLLSYEYLVRYSFIGRLLNGRKRKRIANQFTEHAA